MKNKMFFRLQNIKAELINNKSISISVIMSIIIGGVFSIGLISLGFNIYKDIEVRADDYKDIYMLSYDKDNFTVKEAMKKYEEIEYISADCGGKVSIMKDGKFSIVRSVKAQINYPGMFKDFIKVGRYFEEQDYKDKSKVCVLGENYYTEGSLGKEVMIDGERYTVVGYIRIKDYSDLVFMPLFEEEIMNDDLSLVYKMKVKKSTSKTEIKEIIEDITGKEFSRSISAEEYFKNYTKNRIQLFWLMIVVATIVFMYSMINICTMFINKLDNDKKTMGIKIALGATRKDIFYEVFWQLNILMIIGLVISMGIVNISAVFTRKIGLTFEAAIVILVLGIIWNGILTKTIISKTTKNESVRQVIKG